MADIKGTGQPVKQPSQSRWQKGTGWSTVEIWDMASDDNITAMGFAAQLIQGGYTEVCVHQTQPCVWRVEGTIAGQGEGSPEDPVDTWELLSTAESVGTITHPKVALMPDNVVRSIREHAENPSEDVSPALQDEDQRRLYELYLRQITSYAQPQHILRNTVVGDDTRLAGRIVMAGELQIWSGDQLPTLPVSIAAAIDSIPVQYEHSADFFYGWLKQPPNITVDIFGKAQYTAEWWGPNWWSIFLYRTYSG